MVTLSASRNAMGDDDCLSASRNATGDDDSLSARGALTRLRGKGCPQTTPTEPQNLTVNTVSRIVISKSLVTIQNSHKYNGISLHACLSTFHLKVHLLERGLLWLDVKKLEVEVYSHYSFTEKNRFIYEVRRTSSTCQILRAVLSYTKVTKEILVTVTK